MATSPVSSTPAPVFFGTISSAWQISTVEPEGKGSSAALSEAGSETSIDKAERDRLLLEHMPVVRFVARKIHERLPQHVELEDLVGAGIVGLIDAFHKFDRKKEVQFRSYAQFRIRGAILDSLRSLDWGSRDLRRKGREIEDAVQRLTHRLNRKPADTEVADELGLPLARYQQLTGDLKSLEIGSLNEVRAEDNAEEELAYVPASPDEDPLLQCMKSQMSAQLSAAVATLPEREARILTLYYVEEMTLKQIGAMLGLAESRISQIRAAAVLELRSRMLSGGKPAMRRPATRATRMRPLIPAAVTRVLAVTPRAVCQA
jgi:RNA polymerase sigma factor FliA